MTEGAEDANERGPGQYKGNKRKAAEMSFAALFVGTGGMRGAIYRLLARYTVAMPRVRESTHTSSKPFREITSRNSGG